MKCNNCGDEITEGMCTEINFCRNLNIRIKKINEKDIISFEILKLSIDARKKPNVKYVEWDISLNKDPYVIKANIRPDHTIYQLPEHRTKGQGLLPKFKEAMEEEK